MQFKLFFFLVSNDVSLDILHPGYGYYKGFKALPTVAKIMIFTSAVAFLILLVIAAVFYCKRNRATTADQLKVKPPSYDEATSTKTKVPMQPLINEV